MKILVLADEEYKLYWDFFRKEDFEGINLIISCGDLKASYLDFLTTMTSIPVLYVPGNHDSAYLKTPPEGCTCIDDDVYIFEGIRILGLGGCNLYNGGPYQYTEKQMEKRLNNWKMKWKLKRAKGIDILVTHAPARGVNDAEDMCHRGFETFNTIIQKYQPAYFLHGHVHMSYGRQFPREDQVGKTRVINGYQKYVIEIETGKNE